MTDPLDFGGKRVLVIGGASIDEAEVSESTLSLTGSGKALNFISERCA